MKIGRSDAHSKRCSMKSSRPSSVCCASSMTSTTGRSAPDPRSPQDGPGRIQLVPAARLALEPMPSRTADPRPQPGALAPRPWQPTVRGLVVKALLRRCRPQPRAPTRSNRCPRIASATRPEGDAVAIGEATAAVPAQRSRTARRCTSSTPTRGVTCRALPRLSSGPVPAQRVPRLAWKSSFSIRSSRSRPTTGASRLFSTRSLHRELDATTRAHCKEP